jgi:protein subunit release factor A
MSRKLLFSLTRKDFKIEFYKAPGAGGQKKNKTDSACRITHLESGAVGNATEERSQLQNKKKAFERLIKSEKFKRWHKIKTSYALRGIIDMEREVNRIIDEQMDEKYLKIEYLERRD